MTSEVSNSLRNTSGSDLTARPTSGPWEAVHDSDGDYGIFGGPTCTRLIAVTVSDTPEDAANAHQIEAAPELLKELKHLVSLLEPKEQDGSLNVPGLATLNGARAVIAKAEGRQP